MTFVLFTLGSVISSLAQVGEWTWIHGPNTANNTCEFGTEGVPSSTTLPCPNYGPAQWIDGAGNLWVYGGVGPEGGVYDDLWKYDVMLNQWAWMGGSAGILDVFPVYGTQGVESATNNPGGRGFGAAAWVGNDGNLYLFGGITVGFFDKCDLWKYNIGTGNWVWLNGSMGNDQNGVYGTQGVPSSANYPAGRHESTANWKDAEGNLWLFGGFSGDDNYNDVWRYNPTTNQWTWMKGNMSDTGPDGGVYGTLGVEANANTPASRAAYTAWLDDDGAIWMFGGYYGGVWENNYTDFWYNDLWRYNMSTNNWTWMNGPDTYNDNGSPGVLGIENPSNLPSARQETRSVMRDQCENFYFFGGLRNVDSDINNVYSGEILTDLWMYSKENNMFTWISSTQAVNVDGVYGTFGTPSAANHPGSRSGTINWMTPQGDIMLYGGNGGLSAAFENPWPLFSDMWKFTFTQDMCNDTLPPIAAFDISDSTLCVGECIDVFNQSIDADTYAWNFVGGTPSSSITSDPGLICYDETGTFEISLIVTNPFGSDTAVWSNIIVSPFPTDVVLNYNNDTLSFEEAVDYDSFLWIVNGIENSIQNNWMSPLPFDAQIDVVVTNESGCSDTASYFTDGAPPIAEFIVPDTTLCIGACVTMNNLSENGNSFSWTFESGIPATSTQFEPTVCYNVPGTFGVTLIVENETGSDTVVFGNIIVSSIPIAPILLYTESQVSFTVNSSYDTFQWLVNDNAISSQDNILLNPGYNAEIQLVVSNGLCSDTSTIITPGILPDAAFSASNQSICVGECITFENSSLYAQNYLWQFEGGEPSESTANTPTVCYTFPGEFDVTLIAFNQEGADTLIFENLIEVTNFTQGTLIQHGDSLVLITDQTEDASYWQFGGDNIDVEENYVTPVLSGLYTVYLINELGCVTEINAYGEEVIQHYVYIPNAITADADGLNEGWFVYGDRSHWVNFKAQIFNRWGDKIFETDNPDTPWIGNAYGGEFYVPDGVYVFYVEIGFQDLTEVRKFKGHVTIIR